MASKGPEFGTLIITGGSSGIGLAILQGFARRYPNANIINISRSAPPASDCAEPISHIEADLCDRTQVSQAVETVRSQISQAQAPILLVNNSGVGQHETFQDAEPSRSLATIDLNISATVQFTHGLLPELCKTGGCIAVVSSTSAFQPTSMMATYGASKAFLLNWTLALGEDLRGTGLRTLALCPGGTHTPFMHKAGFDRPVRSYWPLLSVDQVADAFFRGLKAGRSLVVPGLINRFVAALSKTSPIRWTTPVAAHIMRHAKQ